MRPPYADGDEITEGKVYRRIPALATHFYYDVQLPRFEAFQPRSHEDALSVLLKDYVTPEEARKNPRNPHDDSFGLCEIDIRKVRDVTAGAVVFRYKPTSGVLGHAHVQVFGCKDDKQAVIIAQLAEVIVSPRGPKGK